MRLQMPWSGWFNNQAKKRKKVEPWVMADVTYEEEFHIELVLRNVINYIDPDEVPDLISAFAKENFRLVKIIQQAGEHIDKINSKSASPKNKGNL
jgi:hypothetical protein|tara:strand:+ start:93 stop:377 length:285 start_codon:yes stop_codon:yes gene_type:complete